MIDGESHSRAWSCFNLTLWKIVLRSDLCNSRQLEEAKLQAIWSHPISSESVMKGQINGIKMGDTGRFAPQTMGFVPLVMLLQITCLVPHYNIWWSMLWECSECHNLLSISVWALVWFTRNACDFFWKKKKYNKFSLWLYCWRCRIHL